MSTEPLKKAVNPVTVEEKRIAIGVLDFCDTGAGDDSRLGLLNSIETAVLADQLGFSRYWLTEHWTAGVSTPSPEVLTPVIAGLTERIRVGPAGVLLPFYSPLKVACNALLAEGLFPGRIDLGLAKGGADEATREALLGKTNHKEWAADYSRKVREVVAYLDHRATVPAYPSDVQAPQVWVLGSGSGSAPLAAETGAGFCLSLFHANAACDPKIIQRDYRANFIQSVGSGKKSRDAIAIAGACTDSDVQAQRIRQSHRNAFVKPNIVGTAEQFRSYIQALCCQYDVTEVIYLDVCQDIAERKRSLEIIAQIFAFESQQPQIL